jgi:hypothetical protein
MIASRSRSVLQSAGEAISHDRHFVLKSDTKFTSHFVTDLSTRVLLLSAVSDVLKSGKLLKAGRPNFQIKAQRDRSSSQAHLTISQTTVIEITSDWSKIWPAFI